MKLYYEDASVQVTSEAVQRDGQPLWFDRITAVWYERTRRSWREVAGRGLWGFTYVLPTLVALGGIVAAFALDLSVTVRILVIVASIMIVLGLTVGPLIDPVLGKLDDSFDRGVHHYEIWIEYDGVPVLLLETDDAARFGRIYRALCRAAEA